MNFRPSVGDQRLRPGAADRAAMEQGALQTRRDRLAPLHPARRLQQLLERGARPLRARGTPSAEVWKSRAPARSDPEFSRKVSSSNSTSRAASPFRPVEPIDDHPPPPGVGRAIAQAPGHGQRRLGRDRAPPQRELRQIDRDRILGAQIGLAVVEACRFAGRWPAGPRRRARVAPGSQIQTNASLGDAGRSEVILHRLRGPPDGMRQERHLVRHPLDLRRETSMPLARTG